MRILEMYHTRTCPVNALPTELLAHIFYLGTHIVDDEDEDDDEDDDDEDDEDDDNEDGDDDDDDDDDDSEDEDEDEGPLRLSSPEPTTTLPFPVLASHVCRLWRSVALGSPLLWTTITFSEPPYDRSQIWIERSKNLPIDIDIDCSSEDDDDDEESPSPVSDNDIDTILDMIVPHVARWRKLDVKVDTIPHIHRIVSRLAQCPSAPLLEFLSLYQDEPDQFELFEPAVLKSPFVPFHGNAPNLSYVSLVGVHICWSSPLLHDLVEFELAFHAKDVRPSWVDFSRILRDSPRLTSLQLCLSGPAEPVTDWEDEPIELPLLDSLSLGCLDPTYVLSLIRRLSMPNLTRLSLDLDNGNYSEFVLQLATRPRSVFSRIEYLKIAGLSCDDRTVVAVMYQQLSNLKSIYLNCNFIDETFFLKLVNPVPYEKKMYCPNLRMITTSGISGYKMRSLISKRATAGFPIERVVMSEDDIVEDEDEMWLRDHVQSLEYFEPSDEEGVDDIDIEL